MSRPALHRTVLPLLFIPLWSSGFLVGTVGANHAPPLTLTFWRFLLAAVVLTVVARVTHAPWPRGRRAWKHVIVMGILLQAVQFAGVYLGLSEGVPAALSSLIMGAAPIVVAAGGVALLGEHLGPRRWAGSVLGLAGVIVAVSGSLGHQSIGGGIAFTVLALAGLSAGTLYQRHAGAAMDLRTGGAVQLGVAATIMLPLAAVHGGLAVPTATPAVLSLLWLALANSIGALSILFVLLRHRDAASVSSMLYVVPPLTAVLGSLFLGQPLGLDTWIGLALATAGLVLATRAEGRQPVATGAETERWSAISPSMASTPPRPQPHSVATPKPSA